jgi:hypothetical protein
MSPVCTPILDLQRYCRLQSMWEASDGGGLVTILPLAAGVEHLATNIARLSSIGLAGCVGIRDGALGVLPCTFEHAWS